MEINQLKPVEIIRDDCGFWIHPEFRDYLNKHHENQEYISQEEWDELKRYFNIQTVNIYLETNVSGDDWEVIMDSCDLSKWNPIAPNGFFLIDINYTEDDAVAIFAREVLETEVA